MSGYTMDDVDRALGLNQPRTTNPLTILSRLGMHGFIPADQVDITDRPMQDVRFLKRVYQGQHQYASVVCAPHDWDELAALVFEVFAQPRNGKGNRGTYHQRQERGGAPLYANGFYWWEDMKGALDRVYELSPLPPKGKS